MQCPDCNNPSKGGSKDGSASAQQRFRLARLLVANAQPTKTALLEQFERMASAPLDRVGRTRMAYDPGRRED